MEEVATARQSCGPEDPVRNSKSSNPNRLLQQLPTGSSARNQQLCCQISVLKNNFLQNLFLFCNIIIDYIPPCNNIRIKHKIIIIIIIIIIEIQRMWNVKTKEIPAIIGATGTISNSFRKYVSNTPGKYEIKELQNTAIMGTAHILRKVLM